MGAESERQGGRGLGVRAPDWLRRLARPALAYPRWWAIAADGRTFREILRLRRSRRRDGASVNLALKPLGGTSISVRPGSSDLEVVWDTFVGRYHLPPAGAVGKSAPLIWDLGSNIGLTMAHMACLYPAARIVGVELDSDNAALCRTNLATWENRCEVIEAAVWDEDGTVPYRREPGVEWGIRVAPEAVGGERRARALSLNSLLAHEQATEVDFVKMDIEGAESRVLRSRTEWAKSVCCLKVEVHSPYSVEMCAADLKGLGFSTSIDARHWASVTGVRTA